MLILSMPPWNFPSIAFFWHPATTNEDLESLLKSEDGGAAVSSKCAFPTTASRIIKKIIIALLPNPIQRRLAPHLYKPSRIHPTSYLDGLRGMCFLFLFPVIVCITLQAPMAKTMHFETQSLDLRTED